MPSYKLLTLAIFLTIVGVITAKPLASSPLKSRTGDTINPAKTVLSDTLTRRDANGIKAAHLARSVNVSGQGAKRRDHNTIKTADCGTGTNTGGAKRRDNNTIKTADGGSGTGNGAGNGTGVGTGTGGAKRRDNKTIKTADCSGGSSTGTNTGGAKRRALMT